MSNRTAPPEGGVAGAICKVCHRPLTNFESIAAGMGPVCSGKSGDGLGSGISGGRVRVVKGARGSTDPTLKAFMKYLASRPARRIIVVSYNRPGDTAEHVFCHGFIVEDAAGKLTVFADGFASNYGGTGPKGLAYAMTSPGLPGQVESVRLDLDHAYALFDGKLAPNEVMHLVRPLAFAVQPDAPAWAAFTPGDEADVLVVQARPRQLALADAIPPAPTPPTAKETTARARKRK